MTTRAGNRLDKRQTCAILHMKADPVRGGVGLVLVEPCLLIASGGVLTDASILQHSITPTISACYEYGWEDHRGRDGTKWYEEQPLTAEGTGRSRVFCQNGTTNGQNVLRLRCLDCGFWSGALTDTAKQ